jgi:RNA-directed DNA polymerase
MMNDHGKSDSSVVPGKPPNRAEEPAAEAVEGRVLAEGKLLGQNASRTLGREGAQSALERVRQAAQRERQQRFTALLVQPITAVLLAGASPAPAIDQSAG